MHLLFVYVLKLDTKEEISDPRQLTQKPKAEQLLSNILMPSVLMKIIVHGIKITTPCAKKTKMSFRGDICAILGLIEINLWYSYVSLIAVQNQ